MGAQQSRNGWWIKFGNRRTSCLGANPFDLHAEQGVALDTARPAARPQKALLLLGLVYVLAGGARCQIRSGSTISDGAIGGSAA
jgi:hypothetical protein